MKFQPILKLVGFDNNSILLKTLSIKVAIITKGSKRASFIV